MNEEQTYPNPAESDKTKEDSFGKFRSAEELLKAYNALESEFTRRSQKLKEYEKADRSEEETIRDIAGKYGIAEETIKEAKAAATETDTTESALIRYLASKNLSARQMASDERVIDEVLSKESNREAVLNAYIESLKGTDVPPAFPKGGAIPTLRPYRPKTVTEAGEIAKAILEKL